MKIFKIAKNDFLSTPEKAWEWAKINVDVKVTEEDLEDLEDLEESEDDLYESKKKILEIELEEAQEKALLYSQKYNETIKNPNVVLYRAIKILSLDDIDWESIGTHWSFNKKNAGTYGEMYQNVLKKGFDVILTGIANTKDIDWEYSFTSFMYYGEDQWECSLNEGSTVLITHIDDEKLKNPIEAEAWNQL
jgi:hypothetical protein